MLCQVARPGSSKTRRSRSSLSRRIPARSGDVTVTETALIVKHFRQQFAKLVLPSDVSKTSDSITNRLLTDSPHSFERSERECYQIVIALSRGFSASRRNSFRPSSPHRPPSPGTTGGIISDRPHPVKRSEHQFAPIRETRPAVMRGLGDAEERCGFTFAR